MEQDSKPNKFNQTIAVLIAIVTLLAAFITFLQNDAGARDDRANRDGLRYILEAFGQEVSGDTLVNFDYNVVYQAYYEYSLLSNSANNRGDEPAANRYAALSEESTQLSPMLAAPYYDSNGEAPPDIAKYESDVYLVKITDLTENFIAASNVKDAWDSKANTYIVHLTLLAVSLFLFGLSVTISSARTRWIFSGSGALIALVAVVWAGAIWATPVFDLRQQGKAIQYYSEGVGLSHQGRYDEAIASFDNALTEYPQYAGAFAERAEVNLSLGKYDTASADYQSAIAAGDKSANTAGMLAYTYYLLGDFEKAIEMDRQALLISPDESWLQFDLALNLLAGGQIDEARDEYTKGMNMAANEVAKAKAAGSEPPSFLWSAMTDAADSLDLLIYSIETGEGSPSPDTISKPDEVHTAGTEIMYQLKSLAVALEYTGLPPQDGQTGTIGSFSFAQPIIDENGEVVDYNEPTDVFQYGIDEFSVLFDYDGVEDGKSYIFKLYINGEEDPSWRLAGDWNLGFSGTAEIPLSYAYSDTFTFEPGEYIVELYIDYHLAQRGSLYIEE